LLCVCMLHAYIQHSHIQPHASCPCTSTACTHRLEAPSKALAIHPRCQGVHGAALTHQGSGHVERLHTKFPTTATCQIFIHRHRIHSPTRCAPSRPFSPSYNLLYARRSSDLSCATARMLLCMYMTPQTISSSVTVAFVFWPRVQLKYLFVCPEVSASPAASRFCLGISSGWCGEQLSPLQKSNKAH
jgi:hypothetical protein